MSRGLVPFYGSPMHRLTLLASVLLLGSCNRPHAWHRPELAALADAADLELLTISPQPVRGEPQPVREHSIAAYTVLGRTTLAAPERGPMLESLDTAIASGSDRTACFMPRHALRGTTADGVVEVIVCFECATAIITTARGHATVAIDRDGDGGLEAVRTAAGLPIAP
jgi:hypothetical protein